MYTCLFADYQTFVTVTDAPDLPSVGTAGNFVAVLSSHTKLGIKLGPDKVQVD